ncbi:hypothetical protein MMC25_004883 [Agyrium rufum]|nr:hypothetical protein [Agyrium rufum]
MKRQSDASVLELLQMENVRKNVDQGEVEYPQRMERDVELGNGDELLMNAEVRDFSWRDVNVTVKDRVTKQPRNILSNISGNIISGEMLALMGPSGSGKSTLLNVLAHRTATASAQVEGSVLVNDQSVSPATFRHITSYVEQEDTLLGALTVFETLDYAARLALPRLYLKKDRRRLVQSLIVSFGLEEQAGTLVGTSIQKGISGGQKRRVGVASQLITGPKILFLDEPTSGLDSVASYKVISCIKQLAIKFNLIVIASIHQPSTSTYQLFDKVLLLSGGKTCYQGPLNDVQAYFESAGYSMPNHINPAEFILDTVNIDFTPDRDEAERRLAQLYFHWCKHFGATDIGQNPSPSEQRHNKQSRISTSKDPTSENLSIMPTSESQNHSLLFTTLTLLSRAFIKSRRDVIPYGIRLAMYTGLAIMMGTVWLRLDTTQASIQPYINALFFGSAFLSFMAVAYVPAFLEDRALFVKERANGLYGPSAFLVANFVIGLPYLFTIAIVFSAISYWLSNFAPSGTAFFTWIMWLFLDLLAAESLVVLISSLLPNFVIALAATAFANGLWMSVGGFLVPLSTLNVFWKYVFHYIDYQAYVFQGMMVNEFTRRTYDCGEGCQCMYSSELQKDCQIDGRAVLKVYGYAEGRTGEWVGIMIAIIVVYRGLGWVALWARRT